MGILIFSLIRFLLKVTKRISELKELTHQLELKVELRRDGQLPTYVQDDLDNEVFANQPREFREAWIEFSSVLIKEEKTKITYKSDESAPYFSEERLLGQYLNLRLWGALPSLIVGLGILGTFVGLTYGLTPFSAEIFTDIAKIQKAIQSLLAGVATAFSSSVVGMSSSLIFNYVEKRKLQNLRESIAKLQQILDQLFDLKVETQYAYEQQRLTESITQPIQALTADLGQEIATQLNPVLYSLSESISSAIEDLRQEKEESTTEVIRNLVDQLQESMSSSMNTQVESLADTVGSIKGTLSDLPNQFITMTSEIRGIVDQSRQLLEQSVNSAQADTDRRVREIDQVFNDIIGSFREAIMGHKGELDQATKGMGNELISIISSMKTSMEGVTNQTEQHLEQSLGSINQTMSEMMSRLEISSERQSNVLEDSINKANQHTQGTIDSILSQVADVQGSMEGSLVRTQNALDESIEAQKIAVADAAKTLANEIDRSVNGISDLREGLSLVLTQQSNQAEQSKLLLSEFNQSIDNASELISDTSKSGELVKQSLSQLTTMSSIMTDTASRFESAGNTLDEVTQTFSEQTDQYLIANQQTIADIQKTLQQTENTLQNFSQEFQIIRNGLKGIFSEIEMGLNNYASITKDTINDYLSSFVKQLSEAVVSLESTVEALNDITEPMSESLEGLDRSIRSVVSQLGRNR